MAKIIDVSEQVFNQVRNLNVLQLRGKVPYRIYHQVNNKICGILETQVNDKIYNQVVQFTKLN